MSPAIERTEANYESTARRLKAIGIPGYQTLVIEGLAPAGTAGDRRTSYITGTKIIVPYRFPIIPTYNEGVVFGVCLNEEGEDSDPWIDFAVTTLEEVYQDPLYIIDHILFYKITVRNYLAAISTPIKIQIFQDPLWINQINAFLKGMES